MPVQRSASAGSSTLGTPATSMGETIRPDRPQPPGRPAAQGVAADVPKPPTASDVAPRAAAPTPAAPPSKKTKQGCCRLNPPAVPANEAGQGAMARFWNRYVRRLPCCPAQKQLHL